MEAAIEKRKSINGDSYYQSIDQYSSHNFEDGDTPVNGEPTMIVSAPPDICES